MSGRAGSTPSGPPRRSALNHLTRDPSTVDIATIHAALGSTAAMLGRLPQALDQLARVLEHPDDGVWATDDGATRTVRVHYTATELRDAATACALALRHLDAAHGTVGHLYIAEPTTTGPRSEAELGVKARCAAGDG